MFFLHSHTVISVPVGDVVRTVFGILLLFLLIKLRADATITLVLRKFCSNLVVIAPMKTFLKFFMLYKPIARRQEYIF